MHTCTQFLYQYWRILPVTVLFITILPVVSINTIPPAQIHNLQYANTKKDSYF